MHPRTVTPPPNVPRSACLPPSPNFVAVQKVASPPKRRGRPTLYPDTPQYLRRRLRRSERREKVKADRAKLKKSQLEEKLAERIEADWQREREWGRRASGRRKNALPAQPNDSEMELTSNVLPVPIPSRSPVPSASRPIIPATITPATITPATVMPAAIMPAAITPATITPATVMPAAIIPAAITPATIAPATVMPATITPATTIPVTSREQSEEFPDLYFFARQPKLPPTEGHEQSEVPALSPRMPQSRIVKLTLPHNLPMLWLGSKAPTSRPPQPSSNLPRTLNAIIDSDRLMKAKEAIQARSLSSATAAVAPARNSHGSSKKSTVTTKSGIEVIDLTEDPDVLLVKEESVVHSLSRMHGPTRPLMFERRKLASGQADLGRPTTEIPFPSFIYIRNL